MKHAVLPCLLAAGASLAGCILPVSTGAPLPATTVGKGHIGAAVSGEAPTLDLIADNDNNGSGSGSGSASSGDPIAYGAAPAAALTFTLSYGIGEDTDLEVAGEGALYFFILPLPTGGSIGLRQHLGGGDAFDVAVAGKIGHVGASASIDTSSGSSESSASANYAALQLVVQTKTGFVRPLLAVNLMPARITRDPSDADPFKFTGMASSVTGGLMFVGKHALVGPYLTATNFYSDQFDNKSGWFVSGGLVFAARPDRNRPTVPPVYGPTPPPYAPAPPPYAAPPGSPMPAPAAPEAPAGTPPPPPPPPAPTAAPM